MVTFITLILGAVGGFFAHALTMKVSFKQRTIENKIKVFDSLIGIWVQMRNFIFAHRNFESPQSFPLELAKEFDQMYGQSQQVIGEAILVCEDETLTFDINSLNERLYRTEWHNINLEKANTVIEAIKTEGISLIARMREDIKNSTRFEWSDFIHIKSGLFHNKKKKIGDI